MIQLNPLFFVFLAVFLLRSGIQFYLNWLNLFHLRQQGASVPEIFKETIDPEGLKRISAYHIDSHHFTMATHLMSEGIFLAILLSGFLPWLVKTIHGLGEKPITNGLIFFAVLFILGSLLRIPFNLYETFVIEERHGFNVMSFRLWVSDFLKQMAITVVLGGFLLWLLFVLVVYGGKWWWVWAWWGGGGFEVLMLGLYPTVIAPLFNKFEPIQDESLEHRIRMFMERVGLRPHGIFKMDAGKRTKHTNAYFTGIGKAKRIVLFDTLLGAHPEDEILAILGHEIGHWKKRHLLKQILLIEFISLAIFYGAEKFLNWSLVYQTFGFSGPIYYVGLFLFGVFLNLLGYFAQPLESAISRKFEQQADDFVVGLMGTANPLCSALKRLASDNLTNLKPHPLYAWFYYSHPPLIERIERLRERGRNGPPNF